MPLPLFIQRCIVHTTVADLGSDSAHRDFYLMGKRIVSLWLIAWISCLKDVYKMSIAKLTKNRKAHHVPVVALMSWVCIFTLYCLAIKHQCPKYLQE